MADNASHALASSATAKPTFNVDEEVVVIRNGWTPKKKMVQSFCNTHAAGNLSVKIRHIIDLIIMVAMVIIT